MKKTLDLSDQHIAQLMNYLHHSLILNRNLQTLTLGEAYRYGYNRENTGNEVSDAIEELASIFDTRGIMSLDGKETYPYKLFAELRDNPNVKVSRA